VAYQAIDSATKKTVQTKQVVDEKVGDAVQDFKDLVSRNTR
jgi:hypothetical protein